MSIDLIATHLTAASTAGPVGPFMSSITAGTVPTCSLEFFTRQLARSELFNSVNVSPSWNEIWKKNQVIKRMCSCLHLQG